MYGFNGAGVGKEPRVFFRGKRSSNDLLELSKRPFEIFNDENFQFDSDLDVRGGCGESCEIFADNITAAIQLPTQNDNVSPLEFIIRRILAA